MLFVKVITVNSICVNLFSLCSRAVLWCTRGISIGVISEAAYHWGEFVVDIRRIPNFLRTHKLQGTVPQVFSADKNN